MELVCLGSSIDDYDHLSWRIAREYVSRFINDIEIGLKIGNILILLLIVPAGPLLRIMYLPPLKGKLFSPQSKS